MAACFYGRRDDHVLPGGTLASRSSRYVAVRDSVERPTRFTLSFNLKTAKALGLTISPSWRGGSIIE